MSVLVIFTICQFALLIMNQRLFGIRTSGWNEMGIPVFVFSIVTEVVLIINCYKNSKNKVLEQEKERLEYELEMKKLEEDSANMQAERLRGRREKLVQLVRDMRLDAEKGKQEFSAETIRTMMEENREKRYCANMILNVMLEEYEIRCKKSEISFEVQAIVGELPGISKIHLCSVLSNLMNNAIEAVSCLPAEERKIKLHIQVKADYLVITEENPFAETYLEMDKGDQRGYGGKILEEIAAACDGSYRANIDMERRRYKSTVILRTAAEEMKAIKDNKERKRR